MVKNLLMMALVVAAALAVYSVVQLCSPNCDCSQPVPEAPAAPECPDGHCYPKK